jgi:hypothetical protein
MREKAQKVDNARVDSLGNVASQKFFVLVL